MVSKKSRKHNRLKNYDYSQNGVYFVTICTQNREELFGKIIQTSADDFVGAIASIARKTTTNQPYVKLTKLGECVDETIHIANNNNDVKIDKYVIMPDHIHLIIIICSETGDRGRSPLQYVIRNIKSFVSKTAGRPVWQKSFHDHIIRNNDEYKRITEYIENNPINLDDSCYI